VRATAEFAQAFNGVNVGKGVTGGEWSVTKPSTAK
jgi:hypothetical protein